MLSSLGDAEQLGGTLIYSFAPPPKVLDHKKTDDLVKDENAVPLKTIQSRKAADDSLRRRTAKDNRSL